MDLEAELPASGEEGVDMAALEAPFIEGAAPDSRRKGNQLRRVAAEGVLKSAAIGRGQ